jgi:hypothetical protein
MERLYEIFRQMQDQVNYPGYVQYLETENQALLTFEWNQFLKMFTR